MAFLEIAFIIFIVILLLILAVYWDTKKKSFPFVQGEKVICTLNPDVMNKKYTISGYLVKENKYIVFDSNGIIYTIHEYHLRRVS